MENIEILVITENSSFVYHNKKCTAVEFVLLYLRVKLKSRIVDNLPSANSDKKHINVMLLLHMEEIKSDNN